jgi:hypothetical protein
VLCAKITREEGCINVGQGRGPKAILWHQFMSRVFLTSVVLRRTRHKTLTPRAQLPRAQAPQALSTTAPPVVLFLCLQLWLAPMPAMLQQKEAFEAERKIAFKAKNVAYSWVAEKANSNRRDVDSNQNSIQYWATEATHIFGLDVKADTVCKMICNGNVCLQSPGPGMAMGDEAHSFVEHAILSNINLCQRNGDTELKEATIVAMIEDLLKESTVMNIPRPRHLWLKIKTHNYVILELIKEQQSELRHQMWTTVKNPD